MGFIRTVLGEIGPHLLQACSMHEHVLADLSVYVDSEGKYRPRDYPFDPETPISLENAGWVTRDPFLFVDNARLDDVSTMADELKRFAEAGGSAIVDLTVPGLRCRPEELPGLSEEAGVHIIASTGLYIEESWPDQLRDAGEDRMLAFMIGEIEEGIGTTRIRPGHIGEIGVTNLSDRQRNLLRAAAKASIATGLSMSVHVGNPELGASGHDVAEVLLNAGVDASRVVIGHAEFSIFPMQISSLIDRSGRGCADLPYATSLLDRGFVISIDTFGHNWQTNSRLLAGISDWQRLLAVCELVEAGYASQLVLGTDLCMKILCKRWGGRGYRYLLDFVIPALHELGCSAEDVRQMLNDTPRRLLTIAG